MNEKLKLLLEQQPDIKCGNLTSGTIDADAEDFVDNPYMDWLGIITIEAFHVGTTTVHVSGRIKNSEHKYIYTCGLLCPDYDFEEGMVCLFNFLQNKYKELNNE